MKVGQRTIVRWISQQITKRGESAGRKVSSAGLRQLDAEQLRQVSGGDGSTQLPKTTW